MSEDGNNTVAIERGVIRIEKGIPRPRKNASRGTMYPFAEMEVDDSFLVKCATEKNKSVITNLNAAAKKFRESEAKYKRWRFTTAARAEEGGVRMWRIDDAQLETNGEPKAKV
jgi:hypothetical protein